MPIEWTLERIEIVRAMYPTSTYEEIAPLIPGLTYSSLQTKARRLGIVKCEEYRLAVVNKAVANSVKVRKGKPTWRSKEHPEIICVGCGKVFTVKPYLKDRAKYCTQKCMGEFFTATGMVAGKNNPTYQEINHTCKRCGKIFHVKAIHHKQGIYQYCSNACKISEFVDVPCTWCKKPIRMRADKRDKGINRFCSFECHGCYTVTTMQKGATSIEIAVERVLIALNEPYKPQKPMAKWLVDFYLPQYHLIIECDGDYWHNLPNVIEKDKKKDHWLYVHNYKLLRLTEKDIKADAMKAVCEGLQRVVHDFTPPSTLAQLALWT